MQDMGLSMCWGEGGEVIFGKQIGRFGFQGCQGMGVQRWGCTRFKALSELCSEHGGEYVLHGGRCRLQSVFKMFGGPFAF